MIGRGGVFSGLRTLMLQSIPLGTKCPFTNNQTLGGWLESGTFLVLASTRQSITLQANPSDYAVVKLNEVEHLLNHALEHIQELTWYFRAPVGRSESWMAITTYYLGFFAASAILRLIGRPNVFLAKDRLAGLRGMTGGAQFPGAGSFEFTVGNTLSATSAEVRLTVAAKSHEATWKSVLSLLNTLRADKSMIFAAGEADFYDSLCSKAFCANGIGFDWPSDIRNKVNYRPGHSYRLSSPSFHVSNFLAPWRSVSAEEVFKIVNVAYRRCNAEKHSLACQVEMMTNISIVLYLIARSLYRELEDRRMTDKRWENQRSVYKRNRGLHDPDFEYLCS